MARVPGYLTTASPGQTNMLRTIQCPTCGVVLNVPETAAGRRLKCPKCATKFAAPSFGPGDSAVAESSPASTLFPGRGPGSSGGVELPGAPGGSSGSVELPATRDMFDLPPLAEDKPKAARPSPALAPAADALALFQDEPKSARRPKGAEARARARRCPTCGGVVPVGMSLCGHCGLDLDTGRRVAPLEVIDHEMPAPTRTATPPLGVIFVGALAGVGNLILAIASLVAWKNGRDGAQFLLIVWLFGIYSSAQFLRRKALRPMFIALGLAAAIGAVYLIVLPIVYANLDTGAAPAVETIATAPVDPDAPTIRPITESLDMSKITWGIFSLLGYAAVTVYLNSPSLRRQFKR